MRVSRSISNSRYRSRRVSERVRTNLCVLLIINIVLFFGIVKEKLKHDSYQVLQSQLKVIIVSKE